MEEQRPGIPENAKLAFKGVIFEVWQWEQEMFDGTKQIFERVWREPSVEILAVTGDKILLEEQDQPDHPNFISLPSGRCDREGESTLEAAKRELLEETGYSSNDWLPWFTIGTSGKMIHEVSYFIARNCAKTAEPQLDGGERIQTKLISFEELLALVDEPRFWVGPQFLNFLLKLQLDPAKKEEFKKKLFG